MLPQYWAVMTAPDAYKLDAVWEAVLQAQVPDFMRSVARLSMSHIMNLYSPYEFNPLGFDPLRDLLNDTIDFDRIRSATPFEMLISATQVATGRARLFRRHEITVDVVLASACLPTLHHALIIDGVAYWDGGFSANPDLVTMAGEGHARDTLIVLLTALDPAEVPTRPRAIASQVNAITFNMPLVRDVSVIAQIQRSSRLGLWGASAADKNVWRHRFHLIASHLHTQSLPATTKAEPDAETFALLKKAGRQEADAWLVAHGRHVGRRSTVDLTQLFGMATGAPPKAGVGTT